MEHVVDYPDKQIYRNYRYHLCGKNVTFDELCQRGYDAPVDFDPVAYEATLWDEV